MRGGEVRWELVVALMPGTIIAQYIGNAALTVLNQGECDATPTHTEATALGDVPHALSCSVLVVSLSFPCHAANLCMSLTAPPLACASLTVGPLWQTF
jgi:hypothetical protein